jgi:hypothetical protein
MSARTLMTGVTVAGALLVALMPAPGSSADGQGRYQAIGYGSYHCDDYVVSYGNHGVDDTGFGDWLAGYLTGINLAESHTYDIKGTLDLNGVRDWVLSYCDQHAGDSVAKAARMFVRERAGTGERRD